MALFAQKTETKWSAVFLKSQCAGENFTSHSKVFTVHVLCAGLCARS